jgi:hypothetical protein
MANLFKSGKDAAGYLFDVAIRKGKAAANREWERIVGSLPEDQKKAFNNASIDIYEQKHIKDNEGLGDAKVQRYREKAAKNMPVDYNKEFGKKPEPTPKPAAKPEPKPAVKPSTTAKQKPAEDENLKARRPTESRVPIKPAAPKPAETPKNAAPFSIRGVSNFLGITPDKPAPNSRPSIGEGPSQMLDLKAFPKATKRPSK